MKFKTKTILGIAVIQATLLGFLLSHTQSTLTQTTEQDLLEHNRATMNLFVAGIKEATLGSDLATLEAMTQELLKLPYVRYVRISDEEQNLLVERGDLTTFFEKKTDAGLKDTDDRVFDTHADIVEADTFFGHVDLGFSVEQQLQILADSRTHSLLVAGLGLLLAVTFSYLLGSFLTRQLRDMKRGVSKLIDGEFGYQINIKGSDELADTARAFNEMSTELQRQAYHLNTLLKSAIDAIVMLDHSGLIREFNPAAEDMFGLQASNVMGKELFSLIKAKGLSMVVSSVIYHDEKNHASNAEGQRIITEVSRANGDSFPAEISISVSSRGSDRLFNIFIRDLTEKQKTEKLKSEFVSVVSHELRTPLTAINGSLSLLTAQSHDLPHSALEMVKMASRNCTRLIHIVNDILDVEKIESGAMQFQMEALSVEKILSDGIRQNQGFADQFNVKLVSQPMEEDVLVQADAVRMQQVMANLISNAVKFTPEQSTVTVRATPDKKYVRISVSDEGDGIPLEFQERIFQKFSQAETSSTRRHQGTGLGLNICKLIIDKHGGEINFETRQGEGTTFYFDLPVAGYLSHSHAG